MGGNIKTVDFDTDKYKDVVVVEKKNTVLICPSQKTIPKTKYILYK